MALRTVSAAVLADLVGREPLTRPYRQRLVARLRMLILNGRLPEGVRLPSERELAARIQLSRSTVTAAYADLHASDHLSSRPGAGHFVAPVAAPGRADQRESDGSLLMTFTSAPAAPGVAAAYAAALEQLPPLLAGHGYAADGVPALREALADWYGRRGLPTDPAQIVVTGGALAAINLVTRTLLGPGDRVLVESPSYANALDALRRHGARLVLAPMTETGWDVDHLLATAQQSAPTFALLMPDFHNPTGFTMPAEQRLRVGAGLRRARCLPLIDETLVELSLDGQPALPSFAAGQSDTLLVGSASKVFWGGLRIGWIRSPRALVRSLLAGRASLDLGVAPLEQLVVAHLLRHAEDGTADHRTRLRLQRDTLLTLLADQLPEWRVTRPGGGQSVWIELPEAVGTPLVVAAAAEGVTLLPGHRFFPSGGGERHLRLPFTAPVELLTEAVTRLRRAWDRLDPTAADGGVRLDLIA